MTYTRRNYVEIAEILSDQVKQIKEDSVHMSESETSIANETVYLIGRDLADMFQSQWDGFDRERFVKDAGLKDLSF